MKITIEKKSLDAKGCQSLFITRNYGSVVNEEGKKIKRRKRQSLGLYILSLSYR